MKKNKLGTALVDICSNFNNIERIIYKYIRECENNQFENSDLVVTTKIITPMFLELGNSKELLVEVVKNLVPYLGFPRSLNTINLIKNITEKGEDK